MGSGWIWVMMMVETPRGSKPSFLILATALPGQSMRTRVPPARSRTDVLSLFGVGTQPPVPKQWISAMISAGVILKLNRYSKSNLIQRGLRGSYFLPLYVAKAQDSGEEVRGRLSGHGLFFFCRARESPYESPPQRSGHGSSRLAERRAGRGQGAGFSRWEKCESFGGTHPRSPAPICL